MPEKHETPSPASATAAAAEAEAMPEDPKDVTAETGATAAEASEDGHGVEEAEGPATEEEGPLDSVPAAGDVRAEVAGDDEKHGTDEASAASDGGAHGKEAEGTVTPRPMKEDGRDSPDGLETPGERRTTPKSEGTTPSESPGGKHLYHHDQQQQQYPPYPTSPMMPHPYYGGYMYPPMYSYGGYPPPSYQGHHPPYGPGGHPQYPPYNMMPPDGSHHQPPGEGGSSSYLPSDFVPPPLHALPPTSPVVSPKDGSVASGPGNHYMPYQRPSYGYSPYSRGGEEAFGSKYQPMPATHHADSGGRNTDKENAAAEDSADEGEDADGEGGAAGPRSNPRLQVYIKSKQMVPRDVLDRRNHKNAASRARSAGYRTRVAQIELKPLSDRSESENDLVAMYNKRRHKKNERSRVRSVERKETIDRILSLPEKRRTKLEKQFLEAALEAKQRKNQGDRLRRKRMKELGDDAKRMAMTARAVAATARGGGGGGGEPPGGPHMPPHPYQYAYHGYHPYGMMPPPPGYHSMMGHPQGPATPPHFGPGGHPPEGPPHGGPPYGPPLASPDDAARVPI